MVEFLLLCDIDATSLIMGRTIRWDVPCSSSWVKLRLRERARLSEGTNPRTVACSGLLVRESIDYRPRAINGLCEPNQDC